MHRHMPTCNTTYACRHKIKTDTNDKESGEHISAEKCYVVVMIGHTEGHGEEVGIWHLVEIRGAVKAT